MTAPKVYNGSTWDDIVINVWTGSKWRQKGEYHNGSEFEPIHSLRNTPLVEAIADGQVNSLVAQAGQAGVQFRTDGDEWEYLVEAGSEIIGDYVIRGYAADVWIENIVTSGSWSFASTASGVRSQILANKLYQVTKGSPGIKTVTCSFKFWDAASGGTLLQETDSEVWSFEYISP